jgi:diaminopimelate epimerase
MRDALPFSKYQGLGNDFILLDNRHQPELLLNPEQVKQWCDRHFGIGADGVIFLLQDSDGQWRMRLINSDGSEAEMCGNGIRCLAKFMQSLGIPPTAEQYAIQTGAGLRSVQLTPEGAVTVDMGVPALLGKQIPTTLVPPDTEAIAVPLVVAGQPWAVTLVSMGNPHCVTFVAEVDQVDYTAIGPQFEHHPAFPERINTEFVAVQDRQTLKMRVWERGAGATLACGTGACASVVAGVLNNLCDRQCRVQLLGGDLLIHWLDTTNHVLMTGPAELVFQGVMAVR